ncbi:MAG: hypothetical protein Q8R02_11400 [Hyphomonadaceae bacterium]|nr:hypothetical protein [Hyphomonadaceae bacterium]
MKRVAAVLALTPLAAPAVAQVADPEIDALTKKYVQLFNKGDAATLASEVYANGDQAALDAKFKELRADSFGKLDVYGFKACPVAGDTAKVEMRYAQLFTFGGKMNDDEAKLFDLVKTPTGWRIKGETDTKFDQPLAC